MVCSLGEPLDRNYSKTSEMRKLTFFIQYGKTEYEYGTELAAR